MRRSTWPDDVRFLKTDESFKICNGRSSAACTATWGPTAHAAPPRTSPSGRRANIGHTHSAGIYDGLYVAGTSSTLDMGYNKGPSSWSHSHVVTYPNGKRTMVTMYAGKWRA
jgi:hypothetical protein